MQDFIFIVTVALGHGGSLVFDSAWDNETNARDYCEYKFKDFNYDIEKVFLNTP